MTALDLEFIRARFPAFSEPSLEGFAHFENAGGSYACGPVIERLDRYYRRNKLQPYYPSAPSREAGELMDSARSRLAAWLNVPAQELHLGPSTSQNTYVLAQALRQVLRAGDEVVVTNQDHEANIGAWRRLEEAGIVLREWRVDPGSGELDAADLPALLSSRTRVVAFTHCSNVVGSLHPAREIVELVHAAGAWAIVDGVAFAPHGLPDLGQVGADVYLFSLYKVYGPHLGAMVLGSALNEALPNQGHWFNAGKPGARFVPAGPDHAQVAAANGVVDYLEDVSRHHGFEGMAAQRSAAVRTLFRERETALLQPLLDFLSSRRGVRLIPYSGPPVTPDPEWLGATIRVDTVVKGPAEVGGEVLVVFPSSPIGHWADVPKPSQGQNGVWLLRRGQPRGLPGRVWMAPVSGDYLQRGELERVLRLAAD